MSDLSPSEKMKLERALSMGSGYVLSFKGRTFAEFFVYSCGINIYDDKYSIYGHSQAKRMRAFWEIESNHIVGKYLDLLFSEWNEFGGYDEPPEECLKIVSRLKNSTPVPDIDVVTSGNNSQSIDILSRSIKDSIDRNEPELAIDRLHTYVVKFFRSLLEKRGLGIDKDKPLHSLAGEYVKVLEKEGLIESEMTKRILKSSISILESYNPVRNDKSLVHPNELLNYNECVLILAHITSLLKFIQAIEKPITIIEPSNTGFKDELLF